jgi:hypothetical protein
MPLQKRFIGHRRAEADLDLPIPSIEELDNLDLRQFRYKSFHVRSAMDRESESIAIRALEQVALP